MSVPASSARDASRVEVAGQVGRVQRGGVGRAGEHGEGVVPVGAEVERGEPDRLGGVGGVGGGDVGVGGERGGDGLVDGEPEGAAQPVVNDGL